MCEEAPCCLRRCEACPRRWPRGEACLHRTDSKVPKEEKRNDHSSSNSNQNSKSGAGGSLSQTMHCLLAMGWLHITVQFVRTLKYSWCSAHEVACGSGSRSWSGNGSGSRSIWRLTPLQMSSPRFMTNHGSHLISSA